MYSALEAFVSNNGTTVPSPVDLEQWRSNPPYQLTGCVRVSRLYTDAAHSEGQATLYSTDQPDSVVLARVPPDGQESAALLRHAAETLPARNVLPAYHVSCSAANSTSGCSSS